jgi:hypothetical protein
MNRTNLKLRMEIDHLKHTDTFAPAKVIDKALEVSERVLFPRYINIYMFGAFLPIIYDTCLDIVWNENLL